MTAVRFVLAAALVWVAPWRAVRTIASQRRQIGLLIRTLNYAVGGGSAPLEAVRPAPRVRPYPLAVLAVLLRPGRAVRQLRAADRTVTYVLDAMRAQERQRGEAQKPDD